MTMSLAQGGPAPNFLAPSVDELPEFKRDRYGKRCVS